MLRVGSIVIRVDDLERQVAFWSAALNYDVGERPTATTSGSCIRGTVFGPNVSLDQVRSTVQVPPRIHLDLYAEDQAAEVQRLTGPRRHRGALGQASCRCRLRDPRGPGGQPVLRGGRRVAGAHRHRRTDPPEAVHSDEIQHAGDV